MHICSTDGGHRIGIRISLRGCLSILVMMLACFIISCADSQEQKGKTAILDGLFERTRANKGRDYAQARDELLDQGQDAVDFLQHEFNSTVDEQERWLVEILLGRAEHTDEFRQLEEEFQTKALVAKYARPSMRQVLPEPHRRLGELLLYSSSYPRSFVRMGSRPDWYTSRLREHWDFLRISDSPSWSLFVGEILVKGWAGAPVPAGEPAEADNPIPGQMPVSASKLFASERLRILLRGASGPLDRVPNYAGLVEEDYLYYAMDLLGKLREKRAGGHVLAILEDPAREDLDRLKAAEVLIQLDYVQCLDTMLNILENEGPRMVVAQELFRAIALMGDEDCVPALERLERWSQEPNTKLSEREMANYVPCAGMTIRAIRDRTESAQSQ